jgi:hypothetical protein
LMRGVANSLAETNGNGAPGTMVVESEEPLIGEFDTTALADALKAITVGVLKQSSQSESTVVNVRLKHEAGAGVIIEWQPALFDGGDPFDSLNGSQAIRMSLAAKILEAHGGRVEYENDLIRVSLPLAG